MENKLGWNEEKYSLILIRNKLKLNLLYYHLNVLKRKKYIKNIRFYIYIYIGTWNSLIDTNDLISSFNNKHFRLIESSFDRKFFSEK